MASHTQGADDALCKPEQQVLNRLLPVAMERGIAALTMADIVAATGSNRAWLYKHFGSIKGLMTALLRHYRKRATAQFVDPMKHHRGWDAIRVYLDNLDAYLRSPGGWMGCLVVNTASEAPAHAAYAQELRTYGNTLIEALDHAFAQAKDDGALNADVASKQAAAMVMSTVLGALSNTRLYGSPTLALAATGQLRQVLESWTHDTP